MCNIKSTVPQHLSQYQIDKIRKVTVYQWSKLFEFGNADSYIFIHTTKFSKFIFTFILGDLTFSVNCTMRYG